MRHYVPVAFSPSSTACYGSDASNRAEALADQIKAALNDLGETPSEEGQVEKIMSDRPITRTRSHSQRHGS
jgi:hypothetical protein